MEKNIQELLRDYAERYETADFLTGDPSWFMHQVQGRENKEAMAFVASVLSYGSRKQFMPKIDSIRQLARGEVQRWILDGEFEDSFREGDRECFYRLYTMGDMNRFFRAYRDLLLEYGSLGEFARRGEGIDEIDEIDEIDAIDAIDVIERICGYFRERGVQGIIPKDASSSCKRLCMFLRWMVRDGSPVDLGLWTFIDKRSLIMPMDTHVMQQAVRLGLLQAKTATMATARRLTQRVAQIFPDDPLKADFALFGYGVNQRSESTDTTSGT